MSFENEQTSQVSIIVPIFNQSNFLARCLSSLQTQSYETSRVEIILVDDGSTDDTLAIAYNLAEMHGSQLRVLTQPNAGPAAARNAGIAASNADIVAFIDSDCIASPNWLEQLVETLVRTRADGVGGVIVGADSPRLVPQYLEAVGFYRQRVRNGQVDYLLTGNAAFRRDALKAVGGFTVKPGVWVEDVDLSFKLQAQGYKLAVADDAVVTHFGSPQSLRQLARGIFRYGRGSYALSDQWNGRRKPVKEFVRHSGAVILAPLLAARLIPRVGWRKALQFCPIIACEHAAFAYGLLSAWLDDRFGTAAR